MKTPLEQTALANSSSQYSDSQTLQGKSMSPPPFSVEAGPIQAQTQASGDSGNAGGGDPMSKMESSFGTDFSDVNIKKDSAEASKVGALAYTQKSESSGFDIHFAPGQFKTDSAGQSLLGHELTHVVQQKQGRVEPTTEVAGKAVNDDPGLEKEADEMGAQAAAGKAVQMKGAGGGQGVSSPVQMKSVIQRLSFADAKKKITGAEGFWGTDEEAIYTAIRSVSAADRILLKADAAVQTFIKGKMSGHDLWKAQLLLEYGTESAFPAAITAIWSATKGGGTKEGKIYDALESLNAAQVAVIKAVPGLMDIIKAELEGDDLKTANHLLDGDYATAIKNHKDGVKKVIAEVKSMETSPKAEDKNTAEWLFPKRAGGASKNDLMVLTPTHDSAARAKKAGKDKDDRAFFGDGVHLPSDAATYDAEKTSTKNIKFKGKNNLGAHSGRNIWITKPMAQSNASIRETLVHEVQHDADRHADTDGWKKDYKSPEESWERYKTEFRAYWLDGGYSHRSAAAGSEAAPWDNKRQKSIFDHLIVGYKAWLKPNFDNKTLVQGKKFDELVYNYKQPDGFNLQNSPLIDDFYLQLKTCKQSDTDLTKNPLKKLETTAKALTASDQAMVNGANAKELQERMKDNLEPTVLASIAKIINGGVAPGWVNVNIAKARKTILGTEGFWGTDEKKIYDTIEAATNAERKEMQNDPQIRQFLYDKMSGHDLYKALFMLEYGAVASWPPALKDVYDGTKGRNDHEKIRKALEKLTSGQAKALAKIEGLQPLLKDQLSGDHLKNANQLLSGKYADAIEQRKVDMRAIQAVVTAGLTSADAAWKKICGKLNDPAKAMIYAMTATHDSTDRAKEAKKVGNTAFFGADSAMPKVESYYDSQTSSTSGIHFKPAALKSDKGGKSIYLYNASGLSAADLRTELENFGKTL